MVSRHSLKTELRYYGNDFGLTMSDALMNVKIALCSLILLSCNYYRLSFLMHGVHTDTKRSFVNTLMMERSQSVTSVLNFPVSHREDVLINPNLCSLRCRLTRADYWFAYNRYALICVSVCVSVCVCVCVCVCVSMHICVCAINQQF